MRTIVETIFPKILTRIAQKILLKVYAEIYLRIPSVFFFFEGYKKSAEDFYRHFPRNRIQIRARKKTGRSCKTIS